MYFTFSCGPLPLYNVQCGLEKLKKVKPPWSTGLFFLTKILANLFMCSTNIAPIKDIHNVGPINFAFICKKNYFNFQPLKSHFDITTSHMNLPSLLPTPTLALLHPSTSYKYYSFIYCLQLGTFSV